MSFFRNLINVKPGGPAASPTSSSSPSSGQSAPTPRAVASTPRAVAPTPSSKRTSVNQPSNQSGNQSMRVLIRGDRKTGKSCLMRRLNNEPFIDQHCVTPIIQSINLSINYKTTDQLIDVEIWDVVDTAVSFGINPSTNPPAINQSINQLPLDAATAVNLYKDVNAVIWLVDPSSQESIEYVKKQILLIDRSIDCLIATNFRDLPDDQRVVDSEKSFDEWLNSNPSLSQSVNQSIRYINISVKNGFGMKHLTNWLNVPFLSKQIRAAEQSLVRLKEDLIAAERECDLMNEADYQQYCEMQSMNQASSQVSKLTPEQIRRETEKRIQQERVNALLAAEASKQTEKQSGNQSEPTHGKKLSISDKLNQTFNQAVKSVQSKSKPTDSSAAAVTSPTAAATNVQHIKIDKAAEKAALHSESVDDFVVEGDDDFFGDDPPVKQSVSPSNVVANSQPAKQPAPQSDSEGEFADEEELEMPTEQPIKHSNQSNYEDELDEPDFDEAATGASPFGVGGSINQPANQSVNHVIASSKESTTSQPTTQSTKQPVNPSPFAAAGAADFDSDDEVDEPVQQSVQRPKKQYDFDLDAAEPAFDDDDELDEEPVKPSKPTINPSINPSIKQSKSSFYSDDDELDEPTVKQPTKHKDRSPKSVHFDADDDELDQHDQSINRSLTRSTSPPAGEGEGELAHIHAASHTISQDPLDLASQEQDSLPSMITIPTNQSSQIPDPDLAMFDSPKKPVTLTDFYGNAINDPSIDQHIDQSNQQSSATFDLDMDTSRRRYDDEMTSDEDRSINEAVKVKAVRKVPSDDELELELPAGVDQAAQVSQLTNPSSTKSDKSKKESRRKKHSDSDDDFFNDQSTKQSNESDDDILAALSGKPQFSDSDDEKEKKRSSRSSDRSNKSSSKQSDKKSDKKSHKKSRKSESDEDILDTLASKPAFFDSGSDAGTEKEKDRKRSRRSPDRDSDAEKEKDRKKSSRRSKEDREERDKERDSKHKFRRDDREDRPRSGDREERERESKSSRHRDRGDEREREDKKSKRSKEKESSKPVAVDDRFLDMFSVPDDTSKRSKEKEKKRDKKKSRYSSDDDDSDVSRSSKHRDRDGDKDRKRDGEKERKSRDGDKDRKSKKKSRRSGSDSDSDHPKRKGGDEDDFYSSEYKGRQPAARPAVAVATSSNGNKANGKAGFFSNLLK